MKSLTVSGVVCLVLIAGSLSAYAGTQETCEQREQVLLQLLDNIGQRRAIIAPSEIAEARLQVYIRELESRIKMLSTPPTTGQEPPRP